MQSPFEAATPAQRKTHKRDKRPFEAVKVGFCYAQTATDRFGDDAVEAIRDRERVSQGINPEGVEMPFTWPSLESDDDEPTSQLNSIYRLVPSMQPYRNNLTALSQTYNLYFSAYQGHIFVYVPRSVLRQTLPREPDLQLHPWPTKAAIAIGGVIDRSFPHAINYIITGMLGEEEIVVAAYDDGDVVAYLVREVADSIFGKSSCSRQIPNTNKRARVCGPPKPFFQENVGRSAWGLAVHSKSRLIAVSSNRCEITVFAFALVSCRSTRPYSEPCGCCPHCEVTESGIPRRERNWRIIIVLTSEASNIPNVCFLDNEKGQAEMVCAVDIKGAMWVAEIWKMFQPATRIEPNDDPALRSEEFWPANSRGWGILPIPDDAFMVVNKEYQLFGQNMMIDDTGMLQMNHGRPTISLRKCVSAIPHNPFAMPIHRFTEEQIHPGMVMALNNVFLPLIPGAQIEATPATLTDDGEASETSASEAFGEEEVGGQTEEGVEGEHADDADHEGEEAEAPAEDEETEEEEEEEEEEDEDDEEEDGEEEDEEEEVEEEVEEDGDEENVDAGDPEGGFVTLFVDGVLVTMNNSLAPTELQSHLLHGGPQHLDDALGQLGNAVQVFEKVMSSHASTAQGPPQPHGGESNDASMFRLEMAFSPHNGRLQAIPNRSSSKFLQFLSRPVEYNLNLSNAKLDAAWDRILHISRKYRFLRTYEKDLELMSFEKYRGGQVEYSMMCPDVLRLGAGFHERGSRSHFRATSRISMIAHVPELSLVVVGSPIGRVLLMTPTKLSKQAEHSLDTEFGYAEHGLRLDWILPFKGDEAVHRPRTAARPLHGMAIGPVQYDEVHLCGREANEAAVPRRYRLMLHYRDHSILTYELTRDAQTGKLCFF